MSEHFTIQSRPAAGQAAYLELAGRLDAEGAQALRRRCAELREKGCLRLALDLSAVSFIASSGVGSLLALTEEMREAGGSLQLAALSPAVESVVKLLNLQQFLTITASREEAMRALEA